MPEGDFVPIPRGYGTKLHRPKRLGGELTCLLDRFELRPEPSGDRLVDVLNVRKVEWRARVRRVERVGGIRCHDVDERTRADIPDPAIANSEASEDCRRANRPTTVLIVPEAQRGLSLIVDLRDELLIERTAVQERRSWCPDFPFTVWELNQQHHRRYRFARIDAEIMAAHKQSPLSVIVRLRGHCLMRQRRSGQCQ